MVTSPLRRSASKKHFLLCSAKDELMQCVVKTDKYNGSDAVEPLDLSVSPWVDAVLRSTSDWDNWAKSLIVMLKEISVGNIKVDAIAVVPGDIPTERKRTAEILFTMH